MLRKQVRFWKMRWSQLFPYSPIFMVVLKLEPDTIHTEPSVCWLWAHNLIIQLYYCWTFTCIQSLNKTTILKRKEAQQTTESHFAKRVHDLQKIMDHGDTTLGKTMIPLLCWVIYANCNWYVCGVKHLRLVHHPKDLSKDRWGAMLHAEVHRETFLGLKITYWHMMDVFNKI